MSETVNQSSSFFIISMKTSFGEHLVQFSMLEWNKNMMAVPLVIE